MSAIFKYISDNMEWIFSGIGLFVFAGICSLIKKRVIKEPDSCASYSINSKDNHSSRTKTKNILSGNISIKAKNGDTMMGANPVKTENGDAYGANSVNHQTINNYYLMKKDSNGMSNSVDTGEIYECGELTVSSGKKSSEALGSEEGIEGNKYTSKTCNESIINPSAGGETNKSQLERADDGEFRQKLANAYWNVYSELSEAKREGALMPISKYARGDFGRVYQLPRLVRHDKLGDSTSLHLGIKKKVLILAPNGYGKSSMLKSIMFAMLLDCFSNMEESIWRKFKEVSDQYKIGETKWLPIYLEAKKAGEILENCDEGLDSNSFICELMMKCIGKGEFSKEELTCALNSCANIAFMLDGLDELEKCYLKKINNIIEQNNAAKTDSRKVLTIIASRPVACDLDLVGYEKWNIEPLTFNKDKKVIQNMVREYTAYDKSISNKDVFSDISENSFLSRLITSPALLVDVIKGCVVSKKNTKWETHWIIEETIKDMLKRYDSQSAKTYNSYGEIIDIICEHLAAEYLKKQHIYVDAGEFKKNIKSIIENIRNRKDVNSLKYKTEDELFDLFFTNLSLVVFDGQEIKFLNEVIACHLAAKHELRQLAENNKLIAEIDRDISKYGSIKYDVIIMLASIVTSDSYLFTHEFDRPCTEELLRKKLEKYLIEAANNESDLEEKQAAIACIHSIRNRCYGTNIWMNEADAFNSINSLSEHTQVN